jgi:hypothetical protein
VLKNFSVWFKEAEQADIQFGRKSQQKGVLCIFWGSAGLEWAVVYSGNIVQYFESVRTFNL